MKKNFCKNTEYARKQWLKVRSVTRNWKSKRRIASLGNFDDYMLRDIGVTRDEVQWAAGLPLTVNAAVALEERALRRRQSGRLE